MTDTGLGRDLIQVLVIGTTEIRQLQKILDRPRQQTQRILRNNSKLCSSKLKTKQLRKLRERSSLMTRNFVSWA